QIEDFAGNDGVSFGGAGNDGVSFGGAGNDGCTGSICNLKYSTMLASLRCIYYCRF
ncbi:unnamed protein product, partial [Rotaria socialis]